MYTSLSSPVVLNSGNGVFEAMLPIDLDCYSVKMLHLKKPTATTMTTLLRAFKN